MHINYCTDCTQGQGQSNGYNSNNNNNNNTDFNALLNNPAVLQALSSQMANGTYNQSAAPAPIPHQGQDQNYGNSQKLTPGQTTRFGRVSRPPVAPPMQDQLALLQQILNGGSTNQNQNQNPNASSSTQSHQQHQQTSNRQAPTFQNGQASSYTGQGQSNQARTNGVKRPHSALREQSLPPQPPARATARTTREQSPLVRPVPSTTNGRPKRGDPTSKEERMEQRRIQNSLSGTYRTLNPP